jgi:hypothetical protein
LRAYTSAGDDIIARASLPADSGRPSAGESRRLAQAQARSTETAAVGVQDEQPPLPVVLLVSLVVVLAAAGLVSLALRHRRERS